LMLLTYINEISDRLDELESRPKRYGNVAYVIGTVIEATVLDESIGELHSIHLKDGVKIKAEVVGMKTDRTLLMPLDRIEGIKAGCLIESTPQSMSIKVGQNLLGRVIDANGKTLDGKGPLTSCHNYPVHNDPPGPLNRKRIDQPLKTGVRSIDAFNTIGMGQRIGIFAGSGVGKSTLMGMIARNSSVPVNVIALVGERGREVKE